jgi:hypothetical protein
MLQALLLAVVLAAQDPKPAAKTVEDRLKELDDKLSALELKQKTLANDNAAMEKQLADAKAMRENFARQSASGWVRRYAKPVEFTEKQSAEFEELWYGWTKDDMEKPGDPARWKTREDALRGKLTQEQIPRLAGRVHEEQVENAKRSVSMFSRAAKLDAGKSAALEKMALGRLKIEEGILLAQAHPQETANLWGQTMTAVEASLPELSSTLSEDELGALRKTLEQWKPRQR